MDAPARDPCSMCISRRAVLRAGATGALLAALPVGCTQENRAPMGPVAGGNIAAIQVGTLKVVGGEENVILGRDVLGLYAMTRVCTHQGQLVDIVSVGGAPALHCYGHGSDFTVDGAVIHGPAASPLEHYRVDLDAPTGDITIQGGTRVAATDRTQV